MVTKQMLSLQVYLLQVLPIVKQDILIIKIGNKIVIEHLLSSSVSRNV